MSVSLPKGAERAAERIDRLTTSGAPAQEMIEGVADELLRVVGADSYFVCAADPHTLLAQSAGVVRGMPEVVCAPFWEYEFEVPDFNKFADLARGQRQVADLHTATGGRPERSARWREMNRLMDVNAELRGTFNVGGRGWGLLHMTRVSAHDQFSEADVSFVTSVAPLVARGLRASLLTTPSVGRAGRGPGMAIFDGATRIVSATPAALAWLGEIHSLHRPLDVGMGVEIPTEVMLAVTEARARASSARDADAMRVRVRTLTGGWLVIHASCMRDTDGEPGDVAVVIEPAKASDVAPLIVEAYELTPRELDVTRALARGLATIEIARELHLSRYTVQDHLKSVYEKVGVSSRGELVAKMFADHYGDSFHETVTHDREGAGLVAAL
ncbi:helix-turn-helix transcriptional regulator [Conexibacter stalactiti]|uniref:Helix-turn-helix transcriptional regulator n=1 Tax=Conexibacter stalactiti TaxID=1940611 RepID=A0ABU4HPV4_9ACTN|nr:helix-turn-helix transcriptional regulator [Conexibacter stalactiti]MDW5595275.1 helix-turn-helix transcriptional regulator [Conexibacter stalactiti]MEC5035917.1 helix-turn-helix transcriptional regulator [Conexibacter stalactiti]